MRSSLELALLCALAALACASCEVTSQLEQSEPLVELDAAETAQLCRYTTDVLSTAGWECRDDGPPPTQTEHEACLADPPWGDYLDVGDWEHCVQARLVDACDPGPGCEPNSPDEGG